MALKPDADAFGLMIVMPVYLAKQIHLLGDCVEKRNVVLCLNGYPLVCFKLGVMVVTFTW